MKPETQKKWKIAADWIFLIAFSALVIIYIFKKMLPILPLTLAIMVTVWLIRDLNLIKNKKTEKIIVILLCTIGIILIGVIAVNGTR